MDLPGWQEIYTEHKSTGLQIISAAQDTGGEEAAGKWFDRAKPTFTQIVDKHHTISAAYDFLNVPSAIWIDEQGRIVRKDDGAYSKAYTFGSIKAGSDLYQTAIRDWVKNGPKSRFLLPAKELKARLRPVSADHELAKLNFRLAGYFHLNSNSEKANRYWQVAQKLNPGSWNYHRQDWSFDAAERRKKFGEKLRGLGDKPYYDPIQFPKD